MASIPTSTQLAPISTTVRKYYAATLYALRNSEARALPECREQVAALLREDPYARLDSSQFEEGFRRLFEDIAREMRDELDRLSTERADARRRAEQERAQRRALAMRILTTESVVERAPPRMLTLVPYGVGQFVNGNYGAGWALLATELTLTVGCVTTTSLYAALLAERDANVIAGSSRARTLEALYWTSIVGGGVLAATSIAGALQAYFSWRPERVVTRERRLPQGLDGVQISAAPWATGEAAGASLGGRF